MGADRRLLFVHAHPDDESINNAATMAKYVADGVVVTLVTCTLGELGEVLEPRYAGLAADRGDQLGGYRIGELASAIAALGVSDHRFLGGAGRWRDSGMIGTPGNDDRRAFWRCASDHVAFSEAVDELAAVIRELRPQVLVTYNENGGYGHPDHVMAHRVTMAALDRAPNIVAKVYYNALSRSRLQLVIDAAAAAGDPAPHTAIRTDQFDFVDDEAEITTTIDARGWTDAKIAALHAHRTQLPDDDAIFAPVRYGQPELLGVEQYRLARGPLGPDQGADGRENDLFSGIGSA